VTRLSKSERELATNEIDDLVREIRPLMRGHHRSVQWGALAELMALWLVDHAAVKAALLEPLLQVHVKTVRKLVDHYKGDRKT
jgi:hypothetical protein